MAKTYQNSSGKTFSSQKAAAASNTKLGTNPSKSSSSGSSYSGTGIPAYNAATGATSGKPSKEYNEYLKSLNKKGSANYVPTPDDEGFVPTGPEKMVGAAAPTGLPQPGVPQTNMGELPYDQALKNLNASGGDPASLKMAQASLANKYKQALPGLQASGEAPSDAGAARTQVTAALQNTPQPEDTTAVDTFLSADPMMTKLMTGITELLNPQQQTTSLLQDYKSLYKESGLDEINEQIIDAETVINGTEDDIRNEIQGAGGFGTESQVQAMALARNKSLLVRYNQLVQMKTDATNQLNTLSQLNAQDKQIAQQKVDSQINSMFNLANFHQQAQNNVREQARWLTQTMGVDGLYDAYSQDPRQLGFLERTLGVAPGGLVTLAQNARAERAQATLKDDLQIQVLRSSLQTDALQRENIRSQINERNFSMQSAGGVDPKVLAKIQAAPEYKTIGGVLPAIQAIKAYKDAINKYGTSEVVSGKGKGELQGTYGNAIAAWKTLAALGALSGADFALAETAVPAPTFFARKSTQMGKLDSSLSNAIMQAETFTKRLGQNYPGASDLLNEQLDDIRISADPTKVVSFGDISDMDSILNK